MWDATDCLSLTVTKFTRKLHGERAKTPRGYRGGVWTDVP